jgi:hypothetical protein
MRVDALSTRAGDGCRSQEPAVRHKTATLDLLCARSPQVLARFDLVLGGETSVLIIFSLGPN